MEPVNLCHCCLERPSEKDLKATHTRLGMTETYSTMIEECFVIQLSLNVGRCGICAVCIARLRDACYFKLQVQQSQATLHERFKGNHIMDDVISVKSETDDDRTEAVTILDETNESDVHKDGSRTCDQVLDEVFSVKSETGDDRTDAVTIHEESNESAVDEDRTCDAVLHEGSDELKVDEDRTCDPVSDGRGGANEIKELAQFCKVMIDLEGKKTYACTLCIREFEKRKRWTEHFKSAHLKQRRKTHACPVCKEQLIPRNRWKHMEERHGWPAPTCDDCGRKFSFPFQVENHKKEVHMRLENLVHLCDQCGAKFSSATRLSQHCIMHSQVRNFKCDHCPKAFKTITYLRQHLMTHSLVKGYVCDICDKAFVNYKNLKAHGARHIVEKNFKCEICSKGFKTVRHLRFHLKVHNEVKSHVCPVCEKGYVQSNNLKYHMKKKHPEFVIKK